jgi:hypothetical protein
LCAFLTAAAAGISATTPMPSHVSPNETIMDADARNGAVPAGRKR